MEIMYRINFTDAGGCGSITCDASQYTATMDMLRNDPSVEDIWVEYYDSESGYWEA